MIWALKAGGISGGSKFMMVQNIINMLGDINFFFYWMFDYELIKYFFK
jgi:hypothetical protein